MGFYDGANGRLGGEGEELDEVSGECERPQENDVSEADWDAQVERVKDWFGCDFERETSSADPELRYVTCGY